MLAAFLRSPHGGRLRAIVCCCLTLFATYDSYLFAAWAPPCSVVNPQNNSPFQDDDDDDEMLDTSTMIARAHAALLRDARLPTSYLSSWIAAPARFPDLRGGPTTSPAAFRCEHEHRNGLGAPLLC
jgi:hypothetical protein